MNVVVFASRKGGTGKSTLTAHLSAQAAKPSRRTLLIDADPQGSLSLWHELRGAEQPSLKRAMRGIDDVVKAAKREGYEWVFIDTPPNRSSIVSDAIRLATLVVIPARPSVFDIAAVTDTIEICRELRKPYAVVINAAPAKRSDAEAAIVADARGGAHRDQGPGVVGPDHPAQRPLFRARRGRRSEGVRPGFARSGQDRESVERDRALGEGHQRGA